MFEKLGNIYVHNTCRVTVESIDTSSNAYKEAVENTKKYLYK